MQFLEAILIALRALWTNKLRSFLTLIGVIIGVMTVIAVVSVIAGMNRYVANELAGMGSNTFMVDRFGLVLSDDEWIKALKRKELTMADVEAIKTGCPDCEKVGAEAIDFVKVKYKNQYLSEIPVIATTSNYAEIVDLKQSDSGATGRMHSQFEETHNRQVVLLGWDVKDKLFGNEDPLGKFIKIGPQNFQVIGVAQKKGSFLGNNQDAFVLIPITTFNKLFSQKLFLRILVKASAEAGMEKTQDEVRMILRNRRHVPYTEPDNFGIMTPEMLMDLYKKFTATAFLAMIGISSIALVIGGIVIMNIMLVSVTERTKEVGIRKALGAKRRDILWQFLVEAITVAGVGGLIGILLGTAISKIVSSSTPLPSAVEPWSVVSGLLISTSVGVFFGIYPAMKAAKLDPIEALRYE
jgi:putative ABC transport system permease protein